MESSAATVALGEIAPLPLDLRDGDLLLLLAAEIGFTPRRLPIVTLGEAAHETIPQVALRLAQRGGATDATLADFRTFDTLDSSIAVPTTAMLLAIERAWNLHDQAVQELSPEELHELSALLRAGDVDSARSQELQAQVDLVPLIEAAILLLDTADSVLLPAIEALGENAPWPAQALADPVGVLRIGGTGDDYENVDRILLLEPSGNDTYENNSGSPTFLNDIADTLDSPVGFAIDWQGEDQYRDQTHRASSQGGGRLGLGILLELRGNDDYFCTLVCHSGVIRAVGYIRDSAGNDTVVAGDTAAGAARGGGLSVTRDDRGDDSYRVDSQTTGYGDGVESLGLLWDRNGTDYYKLLYFNAFRTYGTADDGGRGWFVDEGTNEDTYTLTPSYPHGCNDCAWTIHYGADPQGAHHGHGNDNHGGLAYLMAVQEG